MSEPTREEMLRAYRNRESCTDYCKDNKWVCDQCKIAYQAIRKLIEQGKPKVDNKFIFTWDANIATGISEGISLKRMLKDMLEAAGVELGNNAKDSHRMG